MESEYIGTELEEGEARRYCVDVWYSLAGGGKRRIDSYVIGDLDDLDPPPALRTLIDHAITTLDNRSWVTLTPIDDHRDDLDEQLDMAPAPHERRDRKSWKFRKLRSLVATRSVESR